MWNEIEFRDLLYVGSDASCSIGKNMHANCVSYERMYSTDSGTYANVSTHPLNRTDRVSLRVGGGS